MDTTEEKYIGFLKYSGKSIEEGLLDTRKSAEAILGFDEMLRHFLLKEEPRLRNIDFDIPIRIRKGSWEVLIPEIVDKFLSFEGIFKVAATAYAVSLATKAATDGLFETGPVKDIKTTFRNALKSIQWVIKIAAHAGSLAVKNLRNIKINNANPLEPIIEIPNGAGEYLSVPKKYFDLFVECPEKIFSKNARIVEKERILEFGVIEDGKVNAISITENERYIFFSENDEILFPELKHGQYVGLEGEITKSNEKADTIGFQYKGHVLTSRPESGDIVKFKNQIISKADDHLYPHVKIVGVIDRKNQVDGTNAKRPQIIFSEIIPLEKDGQQANMFNK